jgi:integrase
MPKFSTSLPSYRLHKQSGNAVVTLPTGFGGRKDVLLGPFDSAQSHRAYERIIAEWLANGRRLQPLGASGGEISINAVILAFWKWVLEHYRDTEGNPTREQQDYKQQLKLLRSYYGELQVKEFGPTQFKALRERMIGQGLSRRVINQRMGRIKRVFKWGVEDELVPPHVYHKLQAVEGLRSGRTTAPDHDPIHPVHPDIVKQTCPFLTRQVETMVRLQMLSGMRPGEVIRMGSGDLTMSGDVWEYRPRRHKTTHRGHERVILLGPQAQKVLRPWLRPNLEEYLFQPREAMTEFRAMQRSQRKTKVQPSQQNRSVKRPQITPGACYTTHSYAGAIAKACEKAWPLPNTLAQKTPEGRKTWWARLSSEQRKAVWSWRREHRWHPHQLRHYKATEIRRLAGLDAARAILGHRSCKMTEVYAELDLQRAVELVRKLG